MPWTDSGIQIASPAHTAKSPLGTAHFIWRMDIPTVKRTGTTCSQPNVLAVDFPLQQEIDGSKP